MVFLIKDWDNDIWFGDCVVEYRVVWWYKVCYDFNLNGKYFYGFYIGWLGNLYVYGCCWKIWKGYYYFLKFVVMKMRLINF